MLEVLRSDYVRTARAKGLSERRGASSSTRCATRWCRSSRSWACRPGCCSGGAVLTENMFAWPGVGRLAFDAISNRDMPLINGCVLLFAAVFVIVNTLVDLLYALANPRIRYGA